MIWSICCILREWPGAECGGVIKPDVVLYEEGLDDATIRGAVPGYLPGGYVDHRRYITGGVSGSQD